MSIEERLIACPGIGAATHVAKGCWGLRPTARGQQSLCPNAAVDDDLGLCQEHIAFFRDDVPLPIPQPPEPALWGEMYG